LLISLSTILTHVITWVITLFLWPINTGVYTRVTFAISSCGVGHLSVSHRACYVMTKAAVTLDCKGHLLLSLYPAAGR
jgi:hypothetical protein